MKRTIKAPVVVTRGVVASPEAANAAIAAQEEEQRQRAQEKQQRRQEQEQREIAAAQAQKQRQEQALRQQQKGTPPNPPGHPKSETRKHPKQHTHSPSSGRFESSREIQFYQARVGQQVEVVLLFGQSFTGELLWRDTCNISVHVEGTEPRLVNKNSLAYVRPLEALPPPPAQEETADATPDLSTAKSP